MANSNNKAPAAGEELVPVVAVLDGQVFLPALQEEPPKSKNARKHQGYIYAKVKRNTSQRVTATCKQVLGSKMPRFFAEHTTLDDPRVVRSKHGAWLKLQEWQAAGDLIDGPAVPAVPLAVFTGKFLKLQEDVAISEAERQAQAASVQLFPSLATKEFTASALIPCNKTGNVGELRKLNGIILLTNSEFKLTETTAGEVHDGFQHGEGRCSDSARAGYCRAGQAGYSSAV
eukprot:TRINITY_DN4985_c0_g1_i1.p1 TRINITY_DN4985_c0_g1~~TRINITY_DN4985_c0_g1_i1.p1  ORF type:complete len:230 (+),score=40.11 TRINITY_DN4985_c0_g1_i1:366-1055(+)